MATMDLTSLSRVARVIGAKSDQNDQLIKQLITNASAAIANYLGRHLKRELRTEQYSIELGSRRIFLRGYPVMTTPVAAFKNDVLRAFTTPVIDAVNYYLNLENGCISFDKICLIAGDGVFQAVYKGGMADSGVRLIAPATSVVGVFTAAEIVTGSISGAKGTLSGTVPGATVTMDVESGIFEVGETLTGATSGATCVLGTLTTTPMSQLFPEVVGACEQQVSFDFLRRDSMGLSSISVEGSTVNMDPAVKLLKGVQEMLDPVRDRTAYAS